MKDDLVVTGTSLVARGLIGCVSNLASSQIIIYSAVDMVVTKLALDILRTQSTYLNLGVRAISAKAFGCMVAIAATKAITGSLPIVVAVAMSVGSVVAVVFVALIDSNSTKKYKPKFALI